jgi:hypothetical protein
MAGTLTISTLSDGTNSTSATNCIQGSAKAWANINGSAVTIRSSYNVSSVTRGSTGQYVINFTNAFANTDYCVTAGFSSNNGTNVGESIQAFPQTTSSVFVTTGTSTSYVNSPTVCIAAYS